MQIDNYTIIFTLQTSSRKLIIIPTLLHRQLARGWGKNYIMRTFVTLFGKLIVVE
jgi:hypothetical protein